MRYVRHWKWGFLLVLGFAFQAYATEHPKIPLLDENGNNVIEMARRNGRKLVLNGVTYFKGTPFSPQQTCSPCHNYKSITSAYHFQIGATVVSDDWGKEHPQYHNKYLTSPGQFGFW